MEPRMCLTLHNPPKSYGDCIRACVATLTNDDDVPHVFDERDADICWRELRAYLATKGKTLVIFTMDEPFEEMKEINSDTSYMLIGGTANGSNHAVICKNDEIIHNPAYYSSQIVGPTDAGWWIVGVIGDLV